MGTVKFHGEDSEETRICSRRTTLGRPLSRSKAQHHVTELEDPPHKKKQSTGREPLQSFSSEFVHGSSQNVMADDEVLVSFRPEFASTPCAKKCSTPCLKKSMEPQNTAKPNCHLDVFIPDPSPNVFQWCDDVFGVQSMHQCVRSMVAEKPISPLKSPNPQSQDIDAMQVSFEKLLVEHSDPEQHIESATNKVDDKSISVLASDTLMYNGDYVMPYSRPIT